jgi:phosphoribosylaminoimidazolecarboxamide formyltransferase/IMP cyclohydrolase
MGHLSDVVETTFPPHVPVRRAILSVSNKDGLESLARGLAIAGVELYASGGTKKHLAELGLSVRDIGGYTGFPEMLDGRVKTLHPKIHGGILCRHDRPDDMRALAEHGIVSFELVVVNLYPFEETIRRKDVTDALAVENIDIGGPSLIRGAAKNHRYVTVATSAEQFPSILEQIQTTGGTTYELRRELAMAAYALTARYDAAIAEYFAKTTARQASDASSSDSGAAATISALSHEFASHVTLTLQLKDSLRYGENPHQAAALYQDPAALAGSLVGARQLHGKELSYNNLLDLDSAWSIAKSFAEPAAVVIKHNNPCGAAMHQHLSIAMRRALDGDPVSAFGSVIAINRSMDAATAAVLVEPDRFVEAIVAPAFDQDALGLLTTKPKWKANVRLMHVEDSGFPPRRAGGVRSSDVGWAESAAADEAHAHQTEQPEVHVGLSHLAHPTWQYRQIDGGFLVQRPDSEEDPESEWKVVTEKQPTFEQMAELRFGWAIVRHVKSNAITLSKQCALVGVGAGQMSRVDSVEIAIRKAGDRARGSVLASDAFFPFGDSIALAAQAGVSAIIQPGGSKRDDEVIVTCNQHQLPMVFTGRRHFRH